MGYSIGFWKTSTKFFLKVNFLTGWEIPLGTNDWAKSKPRCKKYAAFFWKSRVTLGHKSVFNHSNWCQKHGLPYSRREATLFQGIRLFYNLILKSVILNDIVALFLCKPSAIGSKTAKLLATLDFKMLPEFWCCITCFQVYVEFFLNLVNFFGIFSEISPEIAIILLQKSPYFGNICLDLVTMSI